MIQSYLDILVLYIQKSTIFKTILSNQNPKTIH